MDGERCAEVIGWGYTCVNKFISQSCCEHSQSFKVKDGESVEASTPCDMYAGWGYACESDKWFKRNCCKCEKSGDPFEQ